MAVLGKMIGGTYAVMAVLGTGGTSKVYLAREEGSGGLFAVKEIPVSKAECAGMLAELRLKEKLYHPALPHVWDAFVENGCIYVVMDYVQGIALDRLLRERGPVPEALAVEWTKQLCKALNYLHGFHPPVIYRDMKPSNVILQKDGKVKLIDFGAITQKGGKTIALGTPGYAAPEQYGKHPRSDVRTDVYALGATLYHMLTGHDPSRPPYQICEIRKWNPELSGSLEKIVKKCTRKTPFLRYPNVAALLKALDADLSHHSSRDKTPKL